MSSFGDNLKKIRVDNNLSQHDLADIIDMHATHISRYERNLANPTIEVVKRISEALKVTADQLIYGSSKQKAKAQIQDNELLTMFSKVQNLAKEDVSCVKSLLNAYIIKTDLQAKFKSI